MVEPFFKQLDSNPNVFASCSNGTNRCIVHKLRLDANSWIYKHRRHEHTVSRTATHSSYCATFLCAGDTADRPFSTCCYHFPWFLTYCVACFVDVEYICSRNDCFPSSSNISFFSLSKNRFTFGFLNSVARCIDVASAALTDNMKHRPAHKFAFLADTYAPLFCSS